MAKEDFKKTRTHIDLVSLTNVGTSMAKMGGVGKSGKIATPKPTFRHKSKMANWDKGVKAKKSAAATASKKPPPPKGKR